jgi:hypothetical protein
VATEALNNEGASTLTRWRAFATGCGSLVAIYLLATILTGAYFMGDTADYVDSIVSFLGGQDYKFWEFGHLFWRPLGWLVYEVCKPLISFQGDGDVRLHVTVVLLVLNWLAGLLSVCALYGTVRRLGAGVWIGGLVTAAFVFSNAFLNFTQTGSSYIPGLSLLLLGVYILVRGGEGGEKSWATGLLAGCALAGAVCLWFPYVVAMPAAVVSPVLLFGFDRLRLRIVVLTGVTLAIVLVVTYSVVVIGPLGIHTLAGFKAWVTAASHDMDSKGVTRAVFGLARSFIYMGDDGILFKRYILGDPFNRVTNLDLVRLSLLKFMLFYVFLASVVINLLFSPRGRRMLGLLILTAVPVFWFAVSFDGGAGERYLALYPALFLALSVGLSGSRSIGFAKGVAYAFMGVLILADSVALAKPVLERRQEAAAERVSEVVQRRRPDSRIITVTWQDELVNFSRSYPFHPLNRSGSLNVGALVTPGTSFAGEWRRAFATDALAAWKRGGEVWVSKRVLSPRPRPEWNWVEGDVKRVAWPDFRAFFSRMEMGESAGGDDGFVLIPSTPGNREYLEHVGTESVSLEVARRSGANHLILAHY